MSKIKSLKLKKKRALRISKEDFLIMEKAKRPVYLD